MAHTKPTFRTPPFSLAMTSSNLNCRELLLKGKKTTLGLFLYSEIQQTTT